MKFGVWDDRIQVVHLGLLIEDVDEQDGGTRWLVRWLLETKNIGQHRLSKSSDAQMQDARDAFSHRISATAISAALYVILPSENELWAVRAVDGSAVLCIVLNFDEHALTCTVEPLLRNDSEDNQDDIVQFEASTRLPAGRVSCADLLFSVPFGTSFATTIVADIHGPIDVHYNYADALVEYPEQHPLKFIGRARSDSLPRRGQQSLLRTRSFDSGSTEESSESSNRDNDSHTTSTSSSSSDGSDNDTDNVSDNRSRVGKKRSTLSPHDPTEFQLGPGRKRLHNQYDSRSRHSSEGFDYAPARSTNGGPSSAQSRAKRAVGKRPAKRESGGVQGLLRCIAVRSYEDLLRPYDCDLEYLVQEHQHDGLFTATWRREQDIPPEAVLMFHQCRFAYSPEKRLPVRALLVQEPGLPVRTIYQFTDGRYFGVTVWHDVFDEDTLTALEDSCRAMFAAADAQELQQPSAFDDAPFAHRRKLFCGLRYKYGRGLRDSRKEQRETAQPAEDVLYRDGAEPLQSPHCAWIRRAVKLLRRGQIMPEQFDVNMAVVNLYEPGGHLAVHQDSKLLFSRPIYTVRLFADSVLTFGAEGFGKSRPKVEIAQPRGCVVVMEVFIVVTALIRVLIARC